MEESLDLVSENSLEWQEVCRTCDLQIKKESKQWKKEIQEIYKIDTIHELVFSKKGAIIRKPKLEESETKKPEYEYLSTRKNINLEKLKKGEYTLEELLEIPREYLGNYLDKEVHLKNGPYGAYVQWGEEKVKIQLKTDIWEVTLEDIIATLESKTKSLPPNVLRVIHHNMTIRKGKYGPYVYYELKDQESTSPKIYSLKPFKQNPLTCELTELTKWIENTYGIV
jgi:DNA topoisomerase-1